MMKDTNTKLLYLLMAVLIVVALVQSYVIYDMKHVLESKQTVAAPLSSVTTPSPRAGGTLPMMPGTDPFEQMKRMQEEMQKSFGAFNTMFSNDPFFQEVFNKMAMAPLSDVKEERDAYVIELNIPGSDKQNIEIKSDNNIVKVFASSNRSRDDNGTNYIHKERYIQQFQRSFVLPENADTAKMSSEYANGILTVTIPKK
ncbi:MAG: hypothetical protein DSZ03_05070 [Sulfurimonas sp.]|nr:MAG: hypothetical protein DSZ03_05070 [Sulfurimonas sp.]